MFCEYDSAIELSGTNFRIEMQVMAIIPPENTTDKSELLLFFTQ